MLWYAMSIDTVTDTRVSQPLHSHLTFLLTGWLTNRQTELLTDWLASKCHLHSFITAAANYRHSLLKFELQTLLSVMTVAKLLHLLMCMMWPSSTPRSFMDCKASLVQILRPSKFRSTTDRHCDTGPSVIEYIYILEIHGLHSRVTEVKVKESRNRSGVAQRVPGYLGS
jgi:hypothetical protein